MSRPSSAPRRAHALAALAAALTLAAAFAAANANAAAPAKSKGAGAAGYPTADRVEFVVECMRANGGNQALLYKCSCVVDTLARRFSYDEFVSGSMVNRYREMGGERMGEFRDPPGVRKEAASYREALDAANKSCGIAH